MATRVMGEQAGQRRTLGAMLSTGGLRKVKGQLPFPLLLYFLAIAVPAHFFVGSLYLTGVRLLLLVMIIPLTINLAWGRYGRILPTDILFFLHMIWMAVSFGVNSPEWLVSQVGSQGAEFIGGYLLGRAYVRSPADFAAVARMLLFIICLTLPFAVYETVTGRPIIIDMIQNLPGLVSEPIVTAPTRLGLERVQVIFAHPIHYGLFCSVAFSLIFVGMKGIYSSIKRYFATAAICSAVFFSLSSGAVLSVVFQAGLIFWAFSFGRVRNKWLVLLALCAVTYVVIDMLSNRSPLEVFMSYATFSAVNAYGRAIIFEWGMKNVWANPIFGLGLNDWVRASWMHSGSMDNFWLVIAVRYGIPGFFLIAVGYLLALWQIGRRNFNDDRVLWQFRRAWMITFAGLSFTLSTVHVWSTVYSFTFFLFGAGMWFVSAGKNAAPADSGGRANQRNGADGPPIDFTNSEQGRSLSPYTRFPSCDPPRQNEGR